MKKEVFPLVAATARLIHRPAFKKGLTVVAHGDKLESIVTDLDLTASEALLNGIPELGLTGLATLLPGSFSEEHDDSRRREALEIWQVDPMDGSGDAKRIGMSPTVLVSLLKRASTSEPFVPIGALVYDVFGDYALIGDGAIVTLGAPDSEGRCKDVYIFSTPGDWRHGDVVHIPHRISYPQEAAHIAFPHFLKGRGSRVRQVLTGGAGYQTLQLMRSFLEPQCPLDCPAFYGLARVDAIPNFQPDWKTWDVDPLWVLVRPFGMTVLPLGAVPSVASAPDLKTGVVYAQGLVVAVNGMLQEALARMAHKFGLDRLLEKNY